MIYRLNIAQSLWIRACTQLHSGNRQLAWGRVVRKTHGQICDLVVRRLQWSETPPAGSDYSLLHDFIVIDNPHGRRTEQEYREFLESVQLRRGQLLVYVQPGAGEAAAEWVGVVQLAEATEPLQQIRLVGPGMRVFRRARQRQAVSAVQAAGGSQLKGRSADRWSRLIGAMQEEVFRRFRSTEVLLVGAGRLGSLMAAALVRMGLKNLSIVDPDVLQEHNRDCTVGNTPRDVGSSKVEALCRYLHRIRPRAVLQGMTAKVQDEQVEHLFRRCRAVFVCVDNDEARLHLSRMAAEQLKPVLDVATAVRQLESSSVGRSAGAGAPRSLSVETVGGTMTPGDAGRTGLAATGIRELEIGADIRLLLPGSCLACVGGLTVDLADNATERAVAEGRRGRPSNPDQEERWDRDGRAGSLPSINHLAVGAGLQLWQDLLSEQIDSSFWTRLRWVPGQGLQTESGPMQGRKDCPVCHGRA